MLRSHAFIFAIKEFKELIAPTLFFAVSFNIIVLTTQLILDDYLIRLGSFLVAQQPHWWWERRVSQTRCQSCVALTRGR